MLGRSMDQCDGLFGCRGRGTEAAVLREGGRETSTAGERVSLQRLTAVSPVLCPLDCSHLVKDFALLWAAV